MNQTHDKVRAKIVDDFAKWTALSALRSGSPVKSRTIVYGLLKRLSTLSVLFDHAGGEISHDEFDQWHEQTVLGFVEHEPGLKRNNQIGWAAKIVNVYLKTRVYLAGEGRPGLIGVIHPPIDNGLVQGLKAAFRNRCWAIRLIKEITDYQGHYMLFVRECRAVAKEKGFHLIEVEYYWQPSGQEQTPAGSSE